METKGKKKFDIAMMNDRFEYEQEERDGVLIFTLIGSLDIGTVSSVRANIEPLLSSGQHKVLFDLYDLKQVDSSGVTAFIVIFKRVRSNKGDMKILAQMLKNIEAQYGEVKFNAPLVVAPPTYNIVDELKAEAEKKENEIFFIKEEK